MYFISDLCAYGVMLSWLLQTTFLIYKNCFEILAIHISHCTTITINDSVCPVAGRVVFELFADICPRTCENFRCLCTGK